MSRTGIELCEDMMGAASAIFIYVELLDQAAFEADPVVQDAVMYRLMVVGEAAGDLLDRNQVDIAMIDSGGRYVRLLKGFRRMRDLLIHHHWKVNLQIIWDTIREDLDMIIEIVTTYDANKESFR
ncbi:DUF86 domain-containing protein [Burkholderia gladioli]|uniref:HepT-like ribonuclease domain-containing protein n=1 Tax=Burkholderia gladioli TaxID=28095 RepID=UPI003B512684